MRGVVDIQMPTMIIFSHLELSRIDLAGNCDYSCWPGWWILYALPHKSLAFWKNYLWTNLSFSYTLKITCTLLRQVISLKKMMVLSVKFTILISWSPICIALIFLSPLVIPAFQVILHVSVLWFNLKIFQPHED